MSLEIRYNEEDSLHGCVYAGAGGGNREECTGCLILTNIGECIQQNLWALLRKKTKCPGGYCCEVRDRKGLGAADGQERYRRCYPGPLWHEEELCFSSLLICSKSGISLGPLPAALQAGG